MPAMPTGMLSMLSALPCGVVGAGCRSNLPARLGADARARHSGPARVHGHARRSCPRPAPST
eukprot:3213214-Rhodomonas_salina.1